MAGRLAQTNLTGGEQSPQLRGQVTFKGYQNGAEVLKNMTVRVTGGAARRAGSLYIADAYRDDWRSWLYPFLFSNEQAYVLEFSATDTPEECVIRIFKDRALLTGDGSGPQLLLNGGFDTDLASWTVTNTGPTGGEGSTVWTAAGGGAARMNGGGAGDTTIGQGVATTIGTDYVVTWNATWRITLRVGTASLDASIVDELVPAGPQKRKFTATSTTTWIQFYTDENLDIDLQQVVLQVAAAIEVAAPYTNDQARALRVRAQSADVMYIFHPDVQPHKLLRVTAILWELRPVGFVPPPTRELPQTFEGTLTPAATTGANIQFLASGVPFIAADVNKILRAGAGRASIAVVDSASEVHADILDDFSSTDAIASGQWFLIGSPSSTVTPAFPGGMASAPPGTVITLTTDIPSWKVTDLGNYVRFLAGGFAQITVVTSNVLVGAVAIATFPSTDPATPGAWTVEHAIWSDERGWPGAGVFHEQRLVAGGSRAEPLTIAASATGDFENFYTGVNDNEGYQYQIPGPFDLIRDLVSLRILLLLTGGAVFQARGATDTPITPTSIYVVQENDKGSDFNAAGLVANAAILSVLRGATRIFETAYSFADDAYNAVDLTRLVDSLVAAGLVQLARVTSPDSYVLAVRTDGALLCCCYERPEQVVGWSRWITGFAQDLSDGAYESVCVIPNECGNADEVWVETARIIDGEVRRFIEVFDGAMSVDCGVRYDGVAVDTLTVAHLTNATAQVVADGVDFQTPVSDIGEVLTGGASVIQAGLPFTSRLRTLPPEMNTETGPTLARKRRMADAWIRLLCAGPGWTINGQPFVPVPGEEDDEVQDGLVQQLGWDRLGRIVVEQRRPFAGTVLAIGGRMEPEDA